MNRFLDSGSQGFCLLIPLLGDSLFPELILEVWSIIWENLHGVMDTAMITGHLNLCPFCGREVRRRWGIPESSLPFYLWYSMSVIHSSRSSTPEVGSDAGGTYSHPTALLSLGCLYKFLDAYRDGES